MNAAEVRREAMARAAAAVADFDPSETAGDGILCSQCGEECTHSRSGEDAVLSGGPRLVRYWCGRNARDGGRGRGRGHGRGGSAGAGCCDWRLCFFCANALDSNDAVRCDVCRDEAQERVDSDAEESSSSSSEENGEEEEEEEEEDDDDELVE